MQADPLVVLRAIRLPEPWIEDVANTFLTVDQNATQDQVVASFFDQGIGQVDEGIGKQIREHDGPSARHVGERRGVERHAQAVAHGLSTRTLDREWVVIDAVGIGPEVGRRQAENAGATADVEHAAAGRRVTFKVEEGHEPFEDQAGRRMLARPEPLPRFEDE